MRKAEPRIDWLKAIILERMDLNGYTREQVAQLSGIGINTFRELMKTPVPMWAYEYRIKVLKALDIKIQKLPVEIKCQILEY